MTWLVFLAHDFSLRVNIRGAGSSKLEITFWARNAGLGGSLGERHPTLDQAIKIYRDNLSLENLDES